MTEKQKEELKAFMREVLARNLEQKLTIELANGIYGNIEGKLDELCKTPNVPGK